MAIALVQHTNKDDATNTVHTLAYTTNPTRGNLLIIGIRVGLAAPQASTVTCADTLGNSWTELTRNTDPTRAIGTGFYCINQATGADTITITLDQTETCRMAIYEYSGVSPIQPLDVQAAAIGTTTPAVLSSTLTPSEPGALVWARVDSNSPGTYTVATNFTFEDQVPAAPNTRMAVEDWIQTTATGTTASTTVPATNWTMNVVAFRPLYVPGWRIPTAGPSYAI